MGKTPNNVILLRQLKQENAYLRQQVERMKGFTLRQSLDVAMIANHEAFGFGPDRNQRFEETFWGVFLDFAEMCVQDAEDDDEIVYTKAKFDRQLRAAAGEDYPEFDERYRDENLYRREHLAK